MYVLLLAISFAAKSKFFEPQREMKIGLRMWNMRNQLYHHSCILKKMAKLFKTVISNPFQSSPSFAILAPFCSRITPLVFFFLSKPLFLILQHLNLGRQRNDSKYHNTAPLNKYLLQCSTEGRKWPLPWVIGRFNNHSFQESGFHCT